MTDLAALRANAAYNASDRGPTKYGPMVCVCEHTDARLGVNFGQCSKCRRKPVALMALGANDHRPQV